MGRRETSRRGTIAPRHLQRSDQEGPGRTYSDRAVTEKHLSRDDAYMLASVAVDFNITQLVDGTKGVHAMIPKAIFKGK